MIKDAVIRICLSRRRAAMGPVAKSGSGKLRAVLQTDHASLGESSVVMAGLPDDARKLAFDRFMLLQPHLEDERH